MIDYKTRAIVSLRPNSDFGLINNKIVWHDTENEQPTEEEIRNEVVRLTYLEEVNEYQRKRQAEYPDYTDYLDGVVKGDQDQIDAYIAACQAVKDKYPKAEMDATELASRQAQALFDYQLEEYTKAQARLAQPILSEDETIEPLVTIDRYNEEEDAWGKSEVENPVITKDNEERAAAQEVVSSTPANVKAAYTPPEEADSDE